MVPTRREFLKTSSAGAITLSALTAAGAADRPSERINLAVMGVHGRGKELIRGFGQIPDVEVGWICDPDDGVIAPALAELHKRQSRTPQVTRDVRRALQDKSVTALVVSAPDHWHALATIWGCQAGKHVYVEKPISHNVVEGRRMVQAARKYDRIVQVGTQRRSAAHIRSAAEFIQSGKLGKIPFVQTWIAGHRPSIGRKADTSVPDGVDYNLWLGPAPERPFNPNRFHYNWHWNWDYGTGELGNNGVHALDLVRQIMQLDTPIRVTSGGGKYFYDDDQQTPDTQVTTFDFPGTCVSWEHRIWSQSGLAGEPFGVMFYGEKGTLVVDRKGWHVIDGAPASDKATELERPHLQNFLDCVRTEKRPNADIEEGHKTTRLCHLGNISWRVGRTLRFDAGSETILHDLEANKLLSRAYRAPFEVPAIP